MVPSKRGVFLSVGYEEPVTGRGPRAGRKTSKGRALKERKISVTGNERRYRHDSRNMCVYHDFVCPLA